MLRRAIMSSHIRTRLSTISTSSPLLSTPFIQPSPHLSSYYSNTPFLQRRHNNDYNDEQSQGDPDDPPKLFVVQPRIRPQTLLNAKLEEALNLANSLEQQRDGFYPTEFLDKSLPPHVLVQNPISRTPRADTFFRRGTVSTVKCHLNDMESKEEVDAIFVNTILTGIQQRNLERVWGKPVLDRVGLIIEIFNGHAQTKEAKLQAELAALMYKKSRLVRVRGPDGRSTFGGVGAEVVSARGRGSGGRGFISGAGESELELQRRRILDRRKKLLSEIKEVRKTRATQRAARKRQEGGGGQDVATVAVVGYTNAGKSTLVSALSNSYLYCDDRLFATVDPKLTSVILPSGRKVLLSDTVGFISDLPVQLVEAFHATLEEVVEADLLVHVLDSSAPNLDEHRKAVMDVLEKIGVSKEKLKNMIEVWNKADLVDKEFDIDQFDDEEYESNLSDEEDAESESELLSGQHNHDQDFVVEPLGDDFSDGWLSCGEEQNSWVDYEDGSIGSNSVDDHQNEASANSTQSQSEFTGHVKTSAITGVGLQELLELIDEKLPSSQVVERSSIYDRKWRPPRREDHQIAVE